MPRNHVYGFISEQPGQPIGRRLAQITRDGSPILLLDRWAKGGRGFTIHYALTQDELNELGPVVAQAVPLLDALAGTIDLARQFVDDWNEDCDRDARPDCDRALKRVEAAEALLNKLRPPPLPSAEGWDIDSLAAPAKDSAEAR